MYHSSEIRKINKQVKQFKCNGFRRSIQHRLDQLLYFSKIKLPYNHIPYPKRRNKKHPPNGSKCFVCHQKAAIQHHIIQLYKNGSDVKQNRVPLCGTCHNKVHPWLQAACIQKYIQEQEKDIHSHMQSLQMQCSFPAL